MASHRKIVMKKSAPDEVEVSIGMEFHRKLKREKEPFSLTSVVAETLLEEYPEYFTEYKEDSKADEKDESKPTDKTDAKSGDLVNPNAVVRDEVVIDEEVKPQRITADKIPENVENVGGLDTMKPIPVMK